MSEYKSASSESADRIVSHLTRGFRIYLEHWQEWIVPMLLVSLVSLVALVCVFPFYLLLGPITAGLYWCALNSVGDRPVDKGQLQRGWDTAANSIVASLFVNIVAALPILLLYGVLFGGVLVMAAWMPHTTNPPQSTAAEAEAMPDVQEATPDGEVMDVDGRDRGVGPPHSDEALPPFATFVGIFLVLALYAAMFLAMLLFFVWHMWFGTRMLFALPLIADRGLPFGEAIRQSWSETRVRFWELLILNLAATIICMVGAYAFYVGMIFSIPIGMTILASVYRERFPDSAKMAID